MVERPEPRRLGRPPAELPVQEPHGRMMLHVGVLAGRTEDQPPEGGRHDAVVVVLDDFGHCGPVPDRGYHIFPTPNLAIASSARNTVRLLFGSSAVSEVASYAFFNQP